MKISVIVNLQVEGLHQWSSCDIDSVSFLRNLHRHLFFISCKKTVSHNDRDVEIIDFKRRITQYLCNKYGTPCCFGNMSCEMIAEELINAFELERCSVLEDNENGAEVEI